MYTITSLKAEHKTLAAAKAAFNLKASSWAALVQKINTPNIAELQAEIVALKQQLANGFDLIGFWLLDANFDRSRLEDFGISRNVLGSMASVKKIWKELSLRYHPDRGGTEEQQANLNRLQNQMMAMASLSESVEKRSTKRAAKVK